MKKFRALFETRAALPPHRKLLDCIRDCLLGFGRFWCSVYELIGVCQNTACNSHSQRFYSLILIKINSSHREDTVLLVLLTNCIKNIQRYFRTFCPVFLVHLPQIVFRRYHSRNIAGTKVKARRTLRSEQGIQTLLTKKFFGTEQKRLLQAY